MTTAFVLGAGLGTRLRPLTDTLPKPLVPIFGKPLITFALDHLRSVGVTNFVINTHHLAGRFDGVFPDGSHAGCRVTLVHEPVLLETGGGIKNAEPHLGHEPFLVYSGDILTDVDVRALVAQHIERANDVTLALRDTGFPPSIVVQDGRITAIQRPASGGYDFANISVWNPAAFARFRAGEKTSFVPVLREWIAQGGRIGGVVLQENSWFNIGSRTEYLALHRTISQGWRPSFPVEAGWPQAIHPSARIAAGAVLDGFCAVGAGVEIGDGATVRDSILWEGAKIASRACLEGCIVREGRHAEGTLRDADV